MTRPVLVAWIVSFCATALVTAFLALLNKPLSPISGATYIDKVALCLTTDCAPDERETVPLPYQINKGLTVGAQQSVFVFQRPEAQNGQLDHIFFHSAPRHFAVSSADKPVQPLGTMRETWRDPVLKPILLDGRDARLTVGWDLSEGLILYPFHIGSEAQLSAALARGNVFNYGLAVASFVLMMATLAVSGAIYVFDPRETMFFWLGVSAIPGFIISYQYFSDGFVDSIVINKTIIVVAANFYVYCIMCFMNRLIGVSLPKIEAATVATVCVYALITLFLPLEYHAIASGVSSVMSMSWALVILTVFQLNRKETYTLSFLALFVLLTTSLSVAGHDWMIYHTHWDIGPYRIGQSLPTVMGVATLCLLAQRLLVTMAGLTEMNENLESSVRAKAEELEANYSLISASQTSAALDAERRRLLVELHDGVGGQIANILAYAEESESRDPVLEVALEDAMRDISVMMDSLSTLDASLPTILGGLRHRYEPLLRRMGIQFDWQVSDDGALPDISHDRKLDFIRVVQEVFNNVVKHAQATTVTVETQEQQLIISDNGVGFDSPSQYSGRLLSSGLGVRSMQNRAKALGAEFSIRDTGAGTQVVLSWQNHPAPLGETA